MFNLKKMTLFVVLTIVIFVIVFNIGPVSDPEIKVAPVAAGSSRLSELLGDQGIEGFAQAIENVQR